MPATPAVGVDPELYLRLEGERAVLTSEPGQHDGQLGAIGSALVAVGALASTTASTIVADYALALELRPGHSGFPPGFQQPGRAPVTAPTAPLVALCERTDDHADRTFPYAVLGDSSTELAVTYTGSQDWHEVAKRFPNPAGFPQSLQMKDDTGRTLPAHFEGGGGSDGWVGRFATASPLSQQTSWLELGGVRLLLTPTPSPPVRIEQLPRTTPAADFLRHRIASEDNLQPPSPQDPVIAALIATGMLNPDDPVLDELQAIANFSPVGHPGIPHPAMRRIALQHGGTLPGFAAVPPSSAPPGLPEPWRSMRSAMSGPGPLGLILVGAATPLMEGTAAAVFALTSDVHGFRLDVSEIGGPQSGPWGRQTVQPTPSFAWWARDDQGGTYKGQWQGWGGAENSRRGDVHFSPPLDPAARSLRLVPSLRTCRAVIELALPQWSSP